MHMVDEPVTYVVDALNNLLKKNKHSRKVNFSPASSMNFRKKTNNTYSRVWNRRRAGNNRRAWKICQKE